MKLFSKNLSNVLETGFMFYAIMSIIDGLPRTWGLRIISFIGYMLGWVLFNMLVQFIKSRKAGSNG